MRAEFAAVRPALERLATICPSFTDLPALLAADEPPSGPWDLLILLQSHSGEFATHVLEAARRRWPTARILLVTGVWSSGELRSGTPLTGVVRVSWHAAERFFQQALQDLARQRCPVWGQPLTAGSEPRFPRHVLIHRTSSARAATAAARPARPIVLIDANQPDVAAWLADACRQLELAPVCGDAQHLPHVPDAELLLWLARQDGQDSAHLERLRRHAPRAPLIALGSFLRPAELDLFRQAGALGSLSLPLVFDDLADAIGRALHGSAWQGGVLQGGAWQGDDPPPATSPRAA